MDRVIKLLPFKFIHVLDLNKNVTVIEIGPKTYTCLSDKKIVFGPENMVIIPPNCYCVIENPVVRNENGEVMIDKHGQAVLRYTELEIRLPGDPFPLYPGEIIKKNISPLQLLSFNQALHLRATRDVVIDDLQQLSHSFHTPSSDTEEKELSEPYDNNNNDSHSLITRDGDETKGKPVDHNDSNINNINNIKQRNEIEIIKSKELKKAGEEWYFVGPGHYVPNVSVEVIDVVQQIIIEQGTAVKLRANRDLYDNFYHRSRKNGEIWLLKEPGSYLKHVYEEILSIEKPYLIKENSALRLRALHDFVDEYNVSRHFGEEYLITNDLTTSHLLNVNEEFVSMESAIVLNNREYNVILNPYSPKYKKFLLGKRRMVCGPKIFFLKPPYEEVVSEGEVLVLSPAAMVTLRANEAFYQRIQTGFTNYPNGDDFENEDDEEVIQEKAKDTKNYVFRKPGDEWITYGPGEHWPILQTTQHHQLAFFSIDSANLHIFHGWKVILPILIILCYYFYSVFSRG